MVRRLLPIALAVPFLLGILYLRGHEIGLFRFETGAAIYAASMMLALVGLVAVTGRRLNRLTLQRRRAEARQRSSEAAFRAIAEGAPDGIVTADEEGRILFFNAAAERLFGWQAHEVDFEPLGKLMPDRFREDHARGLQRFLTTGERRVMGERVELVGRHKDGHEFPIELSLMDWSAEGHTRFTGLVRDITGRKTAEEELRASEQHPSERSHRAPRLGSTGRTREARRFT